MIFLSWFLTPVMVRYPKWLPALPYGQEEHVLSGFGPETVDSILLYALEKPSSWQMHIHGESAQGRGGFRKT